MDWREKRHPLTDAPVALSMEELPPFSCPAHSLGLPSCFPAPVTDRPVRVSLG